MMIPNFRWMKQHLLRRIVKKNQPFRASYNN
jgi:hypothetical protein